MATLLIVFGGLFGLPLLAGILGGLNDRADAERAAATVDA